jgi:GT2 family glycosyltransferase
MFFSVIIPTFKRRDILNICLRQLTPEIQNVSPDLFEVIVTDDGLGEGPPDSPGMDFPWVRYERGPQKGPASNRNNGARAASGDWLIFLDDDCLPQPGFLSAYREAVQNHPDCLVFEGSTLAERPRVRLDEEAPINDKGGYLWSCNFLIQRKLFVEIGGFCELYPYACMEDVDFREQLKERNVNFLFVPNASVIHPWRALSPEDKFLNMHLVSHEIFFQRYPSLKPSLFMSWRAIVRVWALGLFLEAPQMKFRGFKRHLARLSTLTQLNFLMGQGSAASDPSRKAPAPSGGN